MTGEQSSRIPEGERRRIAEAVKAACLQAALAGYENAGISGLCEDGKLECAMDAIRMLDIGAVIAGLRFG
ncbi:MAG: acetyltransferase [Acidiferrobacterales bacterium]